MINKNVKNIHNIKFPVENKYYLVFLWYEI